MDQFVQILKGISLFADLTEDEIRNEILPHGQIMEFPKKKYLIQFQEICETFGVVLKGRLNLLHIYGNGNFSVKDVLEEEDLYGLDLICTDSRVSPYYAVAMQQTQVLSFPAELILNPGVLREELRQRVLYRMLKYVANENVRKEYRLAILYQNGLRDRIMTYLTMQANKRQSDTFTVPFSREEMASYLCVNRSCLSHELSLMAQEGIIRFNRNQFTLLKRNETIND